eukprot:6214704-Pleurochrysis_carterae.AAC.2
MAEPAGGRATATFPPTHHPPQPRHGPAQGARQGGVGRAGGRGSSRWCGTSRRGQGQHRVHLPARPTG